MPDPLQVEGNQDKYALARHLICPGPSDYRDYRTGNVIRQGRPATDAEFDYFRELCIRRQLDPFLRQIYATWRWDKRAGEWKMTIITGIDGLRLKAERSGRYQGQVGPFWCGEDGEFKQVWLVGKPPAAAMVGVFKAGFQAPVVGVAHWSEYGSTDYLWKEKPAHMLAKTAEALALRRAFSEDMSGLYTAEEMREEPTMTEATGPLQIETGTNPASVATVLDQQMEKPREQAFIELKKGQQKAMKREKKNLKKPVKKPPADSPTKEVPTVGEIGKASATTEPVPPPSAPKAAEPTSSGSGESGTGKCGSPAPIADTEPASPPEPAPTTSDTAAALAPVADLNEPATSMQCYEAWKACRKELTDEQAAEVLQIPLDVWSIFATAHTQGPMPITPASKAIAWHWVQELPATRDELFAAIKAVQKNWVPGDQVTYTTMDAALRRLWLEKADPDGPLTVGNMNWIKGTVERLKAGMEASVT